MIQPCIVISTRCFAVASATRLHLVTALLDLGRGGVDAMGGGETRTQTQYQAWLVQLLSLGLPVTVWTDQTTETQVTQQLNPDQRGWVDFKPYSTEQLASEFEYLNAVKAHQQDPTWYGRAGWLITSPQARLPLYNPLVMSKMRLLSAVAQAGSDPDVLYFWADAGLIRTCPNLYGIDQWGQWLADELDQLLVASFPYTDGHEIHGYDRVGMARLCHTDHVDYVVRGGFFGGKATAIEAVSPVYEALLKEAFDAGDMGTEENILTALTHRHPEHCQRFLLKEDGLMWPLFEAIEQGELPLVGAQVIDLDASTDGPEAGPYEGATCDADPLIDNTAGLGRTPSLAVYVLTFNSHDQLQMLIESWQHAWQQAGIAGYAVVVIDHSTDQAIIQDNGHLCGHRGFRHVAHGNVGICGGRQWAAVDFHQSPHTHALFLEDDMLLIGPTTDQPLCRSGFPTHIDGLLPKALALMVENDVDLLKLNYSELYGTHAKQWAWCNLSRDEQRAIDPKRPALFSPVSDDQLPPTLIESIHTHQGLAVAIGQPHYSNWPHLITKAGNEALFVRPNWQRPHEQHWMAKAHALQRQGALKSGVLLASPINHCRVAHYAKDARIENEWDGPSQMGQPT